VLASLVSHESRGAYYDVCRVWSARRYWPLTCRRLHDAGIAYRLAPFPAPLSLGLLLDWLLLGFIVLVPTEG